LKILKLTLKKQRTLAVLITLTPGCQNKFIDCEKATVRIALLPIMDLTTRWNSTLEFVQCAYQLQEFTHDSLRNPKYTVYWILYKTQNECTIVKYDME